MPAALIVAALAGLSALMIGCGDADQRRGSGPPPGRAPAATETRHAPPSPLDDCRAAGEGWHALPTSGFYSPPAARLGHGPVGVVFANDSDNDACDWSREARSLEDHGYAVAVFATVGNYNDESQQVLAVGRGLRRTGVRRIAVIGASVGARAALQAGAHHPAPVDGLVAVSAERRIASSQGDLLPIGRHVGVPVLSIGSRHDPLTSFGSDTLAWHRTIPDDRALIVGGSAHGVELLNGHDRERVRSAILTFLRSL